MKQKQKFSKFGDHFTQIAKDVRTAIAFTDATIKLEKMGRDVESFLEGENPGWNYLYFQSVITAVNLVRNAAFSKSEESEYIFCWREIFKYLDLQQKSWLAQHEWGQWCCFDHKPSVDVVSAEDDADPERTMEIWECGDDSELSYDKKPAKEWKRTPITVKRFLVQQGLWEDAKRIHKLLKD